jgi:hypothetical protein
VFKRGISPSFLFLPLSLQERGIKQVPRKIEDFSGCFKGVRCKNMSEYRSLKALMEQC